METDATSFVKSCNICFTSKRKNASTYSLRSYIPSAMFDLVAVDIWGPVNKSTAGNQYVLVAIEAVSKWVELYPLSAATSEQVQHALEQYIYRHGLFRTLQSDNGKAFIAHAFRNVWNRLGVVQRFTPAYCPQANGLVENFMASLRKGIIQLTDDVKTWDKALAAIAFAHNTHISSANNETPFYLLHGRDALLPADAMYELTAPNSEKISRNEEITKLYSYASSLLQHQNAWKNLKYLASTSSQPLHLGDIVALRQVPVTSKDLITPKLKHPWIFPFRIIRVCGPNVFDICRIGKLHAKPILSVHVDRLKKYLGNSVP